MAIRMGRGFLRATGGGTGRPGTGPAPGSVKSTNHVELGQDLDVGDRAGLAIGSHDHESRGVDAGAEAGAAREGHGAQRPFSSAGQSRIIWIAPPSLVLFCLRTTNRCRSDVGNRAM